MKLLLSLIFCSLSCLLGAMQSTHEDAWKLAAPYIMTEDHPLKTKLDAFFSQARATHNVATMEAAGFSSPEPRKYTRLSVTKHPDFSGYIFKIYLDEENFYKGMPELYSWILRIQGVEKVRRLVEQRGWGDRFKVPRKWIYLLPEHPFPINGSQAKHFILVEEDVELFSEEENERIWRSEKVTKELLTSLYTVLEDVGLRDCAKPENIPFTRDGRIAFIDTQSWKEWPVKYHRLPPYLAPEMKAFWRKLTHEAPAALGSNYEQTMIEKLAIYKLRLEAYEKNLNTSESTFELQYWKKKIVSTKKKIKDYRERIKGIELLRHKEKAAA